MTALERRLGIQSVVANVVGWLIGFALCEALQSFISTVLVDGLVIGSAVGIAQWLVLRRWMSSVGYWVLLSIVGFGVGKALAEAVLPSVSTLPGYGATGAIIGAAVGVAQWPVLRRRVVSGVVGSSDRRCLGRGLERDRRCGTCHRLANARGLRRWRRRSRLGGDRHSDRADVADANAARVGGGVPIGLNER